MIWVHYKDKVSLLSIWHFETCPANYDNYLKDFSSDGFGLAETVTMSDIYWKFTLITEDRIDDFFDMIFSNYRITYDLA